MLQTDNNMVIPPNPALDRHDYSIQNSSTNY